MKMMTTNGVARMLAGLAIVAVPGTAVAAPAAAIQSNSPPTANPDTLTINCNSGTGFLATANDTDPDGDQLTVTSAQTAGGGGGYASAESGAYGIITISTPSYPTTFYVSYTISDGRGGTSSSYVTVNVTAGGPYCSY